VPDTKLLTELARQREAAAPARDRLMTTLFLVGALHALLILGVTFTATGTTGSRTVPMLEVTLVQNPVPDSRENLTADYLAQVNQRGSGTGDDVQRAESPHTPPEDPGGAGDDALARGRDATQGAPGDRDLIASRAGSNDKHFFARNGAAAPAGSPLVLEPMAPEVAAADAAEALRLKGRTERELLVTANTRESSVAVYLDAWRRKIEQVAKVNFPLESVKRSGLSGSPVIEVQILADGTLGGAFLTRSSGYAEIDRLALTILHTAAPFEPFPRELAAKHDSLRLEREWQFLGGEAVNSTVRAPADTK
jgi:protein TonB